MAEYRSTSLQGGLAAETLLISSVFDVKRTELFFIVCHRKSSQMKADTLKFTNAID